MKASHFPFLAAAVAWLVLTAPTSVAQTSPPDIGFYAVVKGQQFVQTSPNAPVLTSDAPFVFNAFADATGPENLNGGSLRFPAGITVPLFRDPDGGSVGFQDGFASQAVLNAAYPDGDYIITIKTAHTGTNSVSFNLAGNAYPSTPRVGNFAAAQTIPFNQDFTLTWDAFAGGTTTDFIQVQIEDNTGNTVIETGNPGAPDRMNGTQTAFVIPGNTLVAGQTYRASLLFARATAADMTTFPGVLGLAGYFKTTAFTIQAVRAADVEDYGLEKKVAYLQTSTGSPVLESGLPFGVKVSLNAHASNSVSSASVKLPFGINIPLPHEVNSRTFSFEDSFASQEALDTAYPAGNYTLTINAVNDGAKTLTLAFPAAPLPPPPHINNYDAAQAVDPTVAFTLTWDAIVGGSVNDFIEVDLEESNSFDAVFETPSPGEAGVLNGTATAVVIPAGTLAVGQTYRATVKFYRVTTFDASTYPGAIGHVALRSRTAFDLKTTFGPSEVVGFNLARTSVTNDFFGRIVLNLTGLNAGRTVRIEKYADLNADGVLDAGDFLLRSLTVTDGQLSLLGGLRNPNVPADEDGGTNGAIRVELRYPSLESISDHTAGGYLFRVSDPVGRFEPVTRPFTVLQKSYPQGVTGRVTIAGTGAPLVLGTVALFHRHAPGGPAGVRTDINGNYALYGPPGDFGIAAFRPGYVTDFGDTGITIAPNQIASRNLSVTVADRTISGRVTDAASGAALPGIFVFAQTTNRLMSVSYTDGAGNFTAPVTAGQWSLRAESAMLSELGYVGTQEAGRVTINPPPGGTANVMLLYSKADALIHGRVTDEQQQPLAGIPIYANSGSYATDGRTDRNGNYALGVLGGLANCWGLGPEGVEGDGYLSAWQQACTGAGVAIARDLVLRRLLLRATVAGNRVTLDWTAHPGRTYRLQFKDALTQLAWTDLAGDVVANADTATRTDTILPPARQRYYRVVEVSNQ